MLEVVTRWGDTLLDVALVTGDHAVAGTPIVCGGKPIGALTGRVGLVDFEIRATARPARTVPYTRGEGRTLVPYIVALLAAHVGVWRAAEAEAVPPASASRPVHVTRAFAHAAYVPPDAIANDTAPDTKAHGVAAAMAGPAGAAGASRATPRSGHVAVENIGEEAQLAKGALLDQARRAGILGHTQTIIESYQAILGPDKITSGFDPASVNGAIDGGEGASRGGFGGARHGLGDSGGGSGWGTIGTSHGGAFSSGTSFGHGWSGATHRDDTWRSWQGGDYTYVSVGHHRDPHWPERVAICGPPYRDRCEVTGGLDATVVRRYVRRNIQKLQYCYEKALLETPTIAGAVFVEFSISTDGKIAHPIATGIEPVATCAAGVIEGIELPRASTPTEVSYVLVYSPRN